MTSMSENNPTVEQSAPNPEPSTSGQNAINTDNPMPGQKSSPISDNSAPGQLQSPTPDVQTTGQTPNDSDPDQMLPPDRLHELDLNDCAIEIRNLNFSYETPKKGQRHLLDDFSLTFPRGAIYGFLGPSGCGKTTLTKIIVGLLRPHSGTIKVNGRPINDDRNQLPGPGVGYMPQDTALFEEFSIYETLKYFSNIYGLPTKYREKRIDNLIEFLDLPDKHRRVAVLSGGQKRRTSLAVAIIHHPPILILDEPTVGIDPVLRERIWQHMLELSSNENISILITTHYIEECRRAHVIGLMRNGKLLAENSPNALLTYFKSDNLENVFLQTCQAEENKSNQGMPPTLAEAQKQDNGSQVVKPKSVIHFQTNRMNRLCCLFSKNLTILSRDLILVLIEIVFPLLAIIIFSVCIGNKPFNLKVGLYSEERLNTSLTERLSEMLLEKINKDVIKLTNYSSWTTAEESVKNGDTYGALHVGLNFSVAFKDRLQQKIGASDQSIEQSTINFVGDLSDLTIYQSLMMEFMEAMFKFIIEFMQMTTKQMSATNNSTNTDSAAPQGLNVKTFNPSVNLIPVYGSKDINFRDFMHSSFILLIVFFLSLAMTALTMIQERMKGLLDRTLVAGAKLPEILAALIMVQAIVLFLQIFVVLLATMVIFSNI